MVRLFKMTLILSIGCLSASALLAQSTTSTDVEGQVPSHFLSLASIDNRPEAIYRKLYIRDLERVVPVRVGFSKSGPEVELFGEPPFTLLVENDVESTPADPEPVPYRPVGEIRFDSSWKKVLGILIRPGSEGTERLLSYSIQMDVSRFPSESIRLINVHEQPIAAMVDDEVIALKYREDRVVPIIKGQDRRVPIAFKVMLPDSKWEDVMSTYTRFKPDTRILCLIELQRDSNSPGKMVPDLHLFIDKVEPE